VTFTSCLSFLLFSLKSRYNSDSLKNEGGSVTEHYYKFKKFIESVDLFSSSEDIVYKRSRCIINLYPCEDMTALEIYAG
jgi:hypothetical protein